MNFRYDFGQKIDLTKFRKQALHYIKASSENSWEFYISDYRICFTSVRIANESYTFQLEIQELKRDGDGNISDRINVRPMTNTKFMDAQCFHVFFDPNNKYQITSSIDSSDVEFIVDSLITAIKYLFKIEKLKVFL